MDYIYIYDKNNNKRKMELVTLFNMDNSIYNYIIYKDDNKNIYCGKCLGEDLENLDTNLTKDEEKYFKIILNNLEDIWK